MFVTITTSDHAPFTNHMGITRLQSWHKNISPDLHAFGAKMMLKIHPEKHYMIHFHTLVMREILTKELEECSMINAVHLGNNCTKIDYTGTIDELAQILENAIKDYRAEGKSASEKIDLKYQIPRLKFTMLFLKQQEAIAKGENFTPLHVDSVNKIFTIKDKTGNILCELGEEEQKWEYKWFFDDSWQFSWDGYDSDRSCTFDLPSLVSLRECVEEPTHKIFSSEVQVAGACADI